MQSRSVLLVSYHYLPASTPGSRRLDTLARQLATRGWRCSIITATPGPAGKRDAGIEIIRTTRAPRGAGVRGPAIASPRTAHIPLVRHLAGFPDKYAPWGIALVPHIVRLARKRGVDVVLSSSPPHSSHLAVAAAQVLQPFPWVAEFRDPWMFPSRRALAPLPAAVQRRMERSVLRRADRVIVNTPGNRDALLAANPDLDAVRIRVSTNGYDAALFASDSFPATPAETADLTYVGEIYGGMLERYAAALATLRARGSSDIPRLAVYGTIDAGERRRMHELGLDAYLEDRGFVSHEESVAAMKNARALLVVLPPHERWRTCVPSKVYWYLAARRPIIAVVPDGDTAELVRTTHSGRVLMTGDANALGRELETFVRDARRQVPGTPDGTGTERFAMEHIVDGIDAILREVTDGSPA